MLLQRCVDLGLIVSPDGPYIPVEPKFSQLYDLDGGDALLVRPDGFIASRLAPATSLSQEIAMLQTFRRLLGIETNEATSPTQQDAMSSRCAVFEES